MTKADRIAEVSQAVDMTRKDSAIIVETIFDSIGRAVRSTDKVEIRGFGSFHTRQRQSRLGRNPKTGARVGVPAKKIPFFKPGRVLKRVVNDGGILRPNGLPAAEDRNSDKGQPERERDS